MPKTNRQTNKESPSTKQKCCKEHTQLTSWNKVLTAKLANQKPEKRYQFEWIAYRDAVSEKSIDSLIRLPLSVNKIRRINVKVLVSIISTIITSTSLLASAIVQNCYELDTVCSTHSMHVSTLTVLWETQRQVKVMSRSWNSAFNLLLMVILACHMFLLPPNKWLVNTILYRTDYSHQAPTNQQWPSQV